MSGDSDMFDVRAVRRHRDRAAGQVGSVAGLLSDLAERLLDRLDDTTVRFGRALDLGGRGVVAPLPRARGIDTVCCDLSPAMAAINPSPAVAADAEFLPFAPGSFDLAAASLSLHWINDLPGALIQLRRALRPAGLLLASMPALGTLGELRTALAEAEAELTGVPPRACRRFRCCAIAPRCCSGRVRSPGCRPGGDPAPLFQSADVAARHARRR